MRSPIRPRQVERDDVRTRNEERPLLRSEPCRKVPLSALFPRAGNAEAARVERLERGMERAERGMERAVECATERAGRAVERAGHEAHKEVRVKKLDSIEVAVVGARAQADVHDQATLPVPSMDAPMPARLQPAQTPVGSFMPSPREVVSADADTRMREQGERAGLLREEGSTTEPFQVFVRRSQASLEGRFQENVRPLPTLPSQPRYQTPSPLEQRVHKLPSYRSSLDRVNDVFARERDTDVEVMVTREESSELPLRARPNGSLVETRDALPVPERTAYARRQKAEVVQAPAKRRDLSVVRVQADAATRDLPLHAHGTRAVPAADRIRFENERETALVRSVYASERMYLELRMMEPARAERVQALGTTMMHAPELQSREQALLAHAAAHHRRQTEEEQVLWSLQEDQMMALAVVARARDDEQHTFLRAAKERLCAEGRSLQGSARQELKDALRTFFREKASLDAQFCRREMHALLSWPKDNSEARVYALALESHPLRPFRASDDKVGWRDAGKAPAVKVNGGNVAALRAELVELRVDHAMQELTYQGFVRAEAVWKAVKEFERAQGR